MSNYRIVNCRNEESSKMMQSTIDQINSALKQSQLESDQYQNQLQQLMEMNAQLNKEISEKDSNLQIIKSELSQMKVADTADTVDIPTNVQIKEDTEIQGEMDPVSAMKPQLMSIDTQTQTDFEVTLSQDEIQSYEEKDDENKMRISELNDENSVLQGSLEEMASINSEYENEIEQLQMDLNMASMSKHSTNQQIEGEREQPGATGTCTVIYRTYTYVYICV